MTGLNQLEQSILALEGQRVLLGAAVVDSSIAILREHWLCEQRVGVEAERKGSLPLRMWHPERLNL
jgi:hypothetical protein